MNTEMKTEDGMKKKEEKQQREPYGSKMWKQIKLNELKQNDEW